MNPRSYYILSLIALCSVFLNPLALHGAQQYPPLIDGAEEYVYKTVDGFDLKIWVFKPEESTEMKIPAMLFFFGGGWNGGSPTQFVRQSQYLAERGMVGIVADYRVKSRQGVRANSCVIDALDALRYVTANAGDLGIDRDRIGVGGGSAGGHLAACLGTIHADDPVAPKAMALYNPATVLAFSFPDLEKVPEYFQIMNQLKSETKEKIEQLRTRLGVEPIELSPFHHVKTNSPPAIIFHGTNDSIVPYGSAKFFNIKLKANGVSSELKTYQGAGHGFFNREPYYSQTNEQLDQFLVSLGWLK